MKNNNELLFSKEITIENTTYCGSNCIMCPRESYNQPWSHMDFGFFKNVVDQAIELGLMSLDACGFGDPFMDPQFEKKLRYVRERYPHIKIYTSTTGHMLMPVRSSWVIECVDTLKISNYGFSKETYEAIHRGSLKYEKVINNIKSLLAARKGSGLYIIMLFLVFNINRDEVDAWRNYWENKVDEIMIWLPHNWGGKISVGHIGVPASSIPKSCGRPFRGNLFIRVNGDVSMCCFDYNHQLVIGNLHKQSLRDILMGTKLKAIRAAHNEGRFPDKCRECDQLHSREAALIYSSNIKRKPGIITSHPDLLINLTTS